MFGDPESSNSGQISYDHETDMLGFKAGGVTRLQLVGAVTITQNIQPATDDTYYLGRNDDDSPVAWKGLILKDTTNSKYYRIEVINGVVTATDLTD